MKVSENISEGSLQYLMVSYWLRSLKIGVTAPVIGCGRVEIDEMDEIGTSCVVRRRILQLPS